MNRVRYFDAPGDNVVAEIIIGGRATYHLTTSPNGKLALVSADRLLPTSELPAEGRKLIT